MNIKKYKISFFILKWMFIGIYFLSTSCQFYNGDKIDSQFSDYDTLKVPYQFTTPDATLDLHYDLQEISGLSYFGQQTLAAIEDETGKLYLLDANSGNVKRKIKFAKAGDYEGVEVIEGKIVVMKSNGHFYVFDTTTADILTPKLYESPFSIKNDLEGLGLYQDKLLVACKADGKVGDKKVKGKGIYTYDFESIALLFEIEIRQLKDFVQTKVHFNSISDFDPSGIAVHPVSSDIYIISADGYLLIVDKELKIKEVVKLASKIFPQPEGICFDERATLYISSEGGDGRGQLFVFNPLSF